MQHVVASVVHFRGAFPRTQPNMRITRYPFGLLALIAGVLASTPARAETVMVEAESFKDPGGWVLDTQFTHVMGSPYLLAHGMGTPVKDATTTVKFPKTGTYRVFIRTKDWVAHW